MRRLAVVVVVSLHAAVGAAEPAGPAGADAWLGGGAIAGYQPGDDIDGGSVRAGLELRLHHAFGIGPEVSYLRLAGERDGRRNDVGGIAAIYNARWYALELAPVSLYATFGFGGVVFSDAFPSGGTRLNGTSMFGAGLVARLGARVALRLEARQVHSSNGRGIVPDNPAYDGLELGAHLAIGVSRRAAAGSASPTPADDPAWLRPVRLELFLGARADGYSTVDEGGAAFGGVQGSVEARLAHRFALQVDALAGTFSNDRRAVAAALRAYYRDDETALGGSVGHTRVLEGIAGETYGVFLERYEHPSLLASVGLGYERKADAPDLWFGEVLLHAYPSARVRLLAGFSYANTAIKQTRADIVMNAEWAALAVGGVTLAGYVQYGGNLFTRGSLGVVAYFDRASYAHRERSRGVHGLRFK